MVWINRGTGSRSIWVGRLTEREANSSKYGLWTIGNKRGLHPGKTSKLWYKTWEASPAKYWPGHHVLPGAHGGRWEHVRVMIGQLNCKYGDETSLLNYPRCVDLPADLERTWALPSADDYSARGYTVCRFRTSPPIEQGTGAGYAIIPFDTAAEIEIPPPSLRDPPSGKWWSWLYLELFAGELTLVHDKRSYFLEEISHVFVPRTLLKSGRLGWNFHSRDCRGVAVYY